MTNNYDITAIEEMEHHDTLNNICSHIIGGVTDDESDWVVSIKTENTHKLVMVKGRTPPEGKGTVESMEDLSRWLGGVPVKDILVTFFGYFGGIDGSKIHC